MQAQPQSSPAARIHVSPLPTPPATAQPLTPPQPTVRYLLAAPPPPPDDELEPASAASAGIAQAAGLAHDAGNLLGALGLYCDLLRAPGVLRPEHSHYASELSLIASRSSALIRRLLVTPSAQPQASTAARHERLDLVPHPTAAPLFLPADVRRRDDPPTAITRPGQTLGSVLRNLAPVLDRIAAGAARVSVHAPASLPPIDLSGEALERITVNLVRNAADAIRLQRVDAAPGGPRTRPTGSIRVSLTLVSGRIQLTVEDDGPGVPPAVAAAFLQPRPLPPNASRGLGHRIIHELVTSSGGQLSIRVRPSQGTAFCIKWPVPGAESTAGLPLAANNTPSTTLTQTRDTFALPAASSLTPQGESTSC